jgi:hypothetical protein
MRGSQYNSTGYCEKRFCALWDSQEDQCCIKTMALKKPVDPIQNIINQSYKHPSDASERGGW